MPLSSSQRAWLVVAVFVVVIASAGAAFYFHSRRPLPPLLPGAPPSLISQLPPDAPIVGFIDAASLRAMKNSALVAALMTPASGTQADAEYKVFVEGTGFDYARDLDRAAVAIWPSSLAPAPQNVSQDRTLAIADGRFDQQKIKAYALHMRGHEETQGADRYFVVPGAPPVAFEFLSATRIRISSGPDPAAVLFTPASGPRDPNIQQSIARVAAAPLFLVAGTSNLPDSFYAPLRSSAQLDHVARSVQGVTLAAKPDGGQLTVTLDAQCASMKDSFELATLLDGFRMLGSMALSDPKTRRQMTREQAAFASEVVSRTKVTHQDNWVRLSLTITPQMLGAAASSPADPSHSTAQPATTPAH